VISLLCKKDSETFIVVIQDKIIRYWDHKSGKIWGDYLQWLPEQPEDNQKKILMSRNKIPAYFITMLKVPENEAAEWEACKDEADVYDLVVKDLQRNACKVLRCTKTA
jgi:hypothetical protein